MIVTKRQRASTARFRFGRRLGGDSMQAGSEVANGARTACWKRPYCVADRLQQVAIPRNNPTARPANAAMPLARSRRVPPIVESAFVVVMRVAMGLDVR